MPCRCTFQRTRDSVVPVWRMLILPEADGTAVTRFEPGDEVVGMTGTAIGGHAEFVVLAETAAMTHMPADLSRCVAP